MTPPPCQPSSTDVAESARSCIASWDPVPTFAELDAHNLSNQKPLQRVINKKLSYRRGTARQLHTSFSAHSLIVHFTEHRICLTTVYNRLAELVSTLSAKKPCDIRTFKLNRAFKVIQGHPYWSRQESRMVFCRNEQLMRTLFLKLTKIRQRENGKFVDFNDLTQVSRRPSKKRLRISTNDLYFQKLELLAYISVADSMVLRPLVFTYLCFKVEPSESKTASAKTEFYVK